MASTITLTVSQQILEKMYQYYEKQIIKIPNHTLFQAKTTSCTITAYLSKKVVFQGVNPEIEANKWQKASPTSTTPKKSTLNKKSTLPSNIAMLSAIGCDEVGTGDYFGPIVVCCASVEKDQIAFLQEMGIKDSKALKDLEICQLAHQIETMIPHQCLVLPNEKYNLMVEKGMNANSIKAYLHNQALLKLTTSLPSLPDFIIMDEFVNEAKYYDYLKKLPKQPTIISENLHFIQKGESVHVAVAAASILARASFVKYMQIMSKKYQFELPKGAGAPVDIAGRNFVKLHGKETLQSLTKWHFANTNKILK